MRTFLYTFLSILFPAILSAQVGFDWAKHVGDIDSDASYDVVVDGSGNVYSTGLFQDTVDFDPGPGVFTMKAQSGFWEAYVLKLDPNGNFLWAVQLGDSGVATGHSLALDAAGDLIVTGYFHWGDFDPGPANYPLVSNGSEDVFVCKLDANGNFIWAVNMGGPGPDIASSVAVDAAGNIHTTGHFTDTADFDPGAGVYNLISIGLLQIDVFVSKLDPNGNFIWARSMGGDIDDSGSGITVDAAGNVYTTGSFMDTADFDPGPAVFILDAFWTAQDIFVSKLDVNGDFVWAKRIGDSDNDGGSSIILDASGNVLTTGEFGGTVDFDPGLGVSNLTAAGLSDIFVSKLDAGGNFIWARHMGGTDEDSGYDITVDGADNIYTTGGFAGTADFDPGAGTYNFTSLGVRNPFLSKLDAAGNFLWAKHIEGQAGLDFGTSIKTDPAGSVYNTGWFASHSDFDPGLDTFYLDAPAYQAGYSDAYVLKLSPCVNTFSTTNVTACDTFISPSNNYTWTVSGTYMDTISNAANCDSIMTINVTIDNSTTAAIFPVECDSFVSPSSNYTWTATGTYTDTIPNAVGCDSVITVNLTIQNTTNTISVVACDSFISPSGNYTWTISGNYMDTIPNAAACDSIITVNLTINTTTYDTISPSVCDSFVSPSANYVWTTTGVYTDTIPNAAGCDSIITVNLTVNYSTTSLVTDSACAPYTSPSGNYIWTASGTYMDTLPNLAACDSVITVNLVTLNSSSVISSTTCDSMISPSGNYVWTLSGTYTDTVLNTAGCDSVITVNLTINTVDTSVTKAGNVLTANATGATYQWIDCDTMQPIVGATNQSFTATANGSYAVIVTQNGCTDTSVCYPVTEIGISVIPPCEKLIHVFPNPTTSSITVQGATGTIEVLNIFGRPVLSTTQPKIDLSHQPKGVYFVKAGQAVRKLVLR